MKHTLFFVGLLAWATGCSAAVDAADGGDANHADAPLCPAPDMLAPSACPEAQASLALAHEPACDAMCAGKPDCYLSPLSCDHQGCPNSCRFVCVCGACYVRDCTGVGCSDPPQYC
jgi:hypothetical protein